MSPEVVGKSKKSIKSNIPIAFLRPKPKKVVLSNLAIKILTSHSHKTNYIQYLFDKNTPRQFWIKGCERIDNGSYKFTRIGHKVILTGTNILSLLPIKDNEEKTASVDWDSKEEALKITLSE